MSGFSRFFFMKIILLAVCAVLFADFFLFDAARIDGDSMVPEFASGSAVLVLVAAYGIRNPFSDGYLLRWALPKRNDIVVFVNPKTGFASVKRVGAVGPSGIVMGNGTAVIGGFSIPVNPAQESLMREMGSVPEGWVFVAGDNVPYSVDSRDYGYVHVDRIKGVVAFAF